MLMDKVLQFFIVILCLTAIVTFMINQGIPTYITFYSDNKNNEQ
jgi:hypothetical protein